jgi:integrase
VKHADGDLGGGRPDGPGRLVLERDEHEPTQEGLLWARGGPRDPAVILLEGELAAIIERRWRAREVQRPGGATYLSPWIFHRHGKPVRKFAVAFHNARVAAGVPHKIVHDFRRTALRDLVRAGVDQHVAMQITGHRSPEVFRRYDIVDERDMRQAHRQVAVYRETRTETDNSKVVRL